jgi:hypothetical protein
MKEKHVTKMPPVPSDYGAQKAPGSDLSVKPQDDIPAREISSGVAKEQAEGEEKDQLH